jgi:hypothetical protein
MELKLDLKNMINLKIRLKKIYQLPKSSIVAFYNLNSDETSINEADFSDVFFQNHA